MNRVNRVDSDVSWYQCSIFDVDPSNRAKRSIIRRELAWRVADVEDVGDIQGAQFVEAFTRGKSSNEEVLRHAEQCRFSIGRRGANSVAERRNSASTRGRRCDGQVALLAYFVAIHGSAFGPRNVPEHVKANASKTVKAMTNSIFTANAVQST